MVEAGGDKTEGLKLLTAAFASLPEASMRPLWEQKVSFMCQCGGKAIRSNQWRVCNQVLLQAPEVILAMRLDEASGTVLVRGDPALFPEFGAADGAADPLMATE